MPAIVFVRIQGRNAPKQVFCSCSWSRFSTLVQDITRRRRNCSSLNLRRLPSHILGKSGIFHTREGGSEPKLQRSNHHFVSNRLFDLHHHSLLFMRCLLDEGYAPSRYKNPKKPISQMSLPISLSARLELTLDVD